MAFAGFVSNAFTSASLQEIWFNGKDFLEAFDIVVNNLPESMIAGLSATLIIKGVNEMIRYFMDTSAMWNELKSEDIELLKTAKDRSEWVI